MDAKDIRLDESAGVHDRIVHMGFRSKIDDRVHVWKMLKRHNVRFDISESASLKLGVPLAEQGRIGSIRLGIDAVDIVALVE